MIQIPGNFFWIALLAAAVLAVHPAAAITVRIDYTTDTNNFFGAGTDARATLEAVATFYSGILNDTFSSIQNPPNFTGANGSVSFNWVPRLPNHPTTGTGNFNVKSLIPNFSVAANEYVVFVGARNFSGSTLGIGGPGYRDEDIANTITGTLTAAETTQWMSVEDDFKTLIDRRGETSGFARWGGFFTVYSVLGSGNTWHFNHLTAPTGKIDLYSVAIHEIGHALGIGLIASAGPATDWQTLVDATTDHFTGANAMTEYGGLVPLEADDKHFLEGRMSQSLTNGANQEVAMDPSLLVGTRKQLTRLDAAALKDIGWEIVLPSLTVPGDYNGDQVVDAADYTVWRNNLGDATEADINFAGNGSGGVNEADYTWWKARYGNSAMSGSGGLAGYGPLTVPEPGAGALLVLGVIVALLGGSRSTPRRG